MRSAHRSITPEEFDAALFDLDGVLTATAKIHAAAWKRMFDDYLRSRAGGGGEPFRPFDIRQDYELHVDGKPRIDGVRDFLESRGIRLPEGTPDDPATAETAYGLGARKNDRVNETLDRDGVEPFEDAVALVRGLLQAGIRTAVVSSSQNCEVILSAAGIRDLFELWVDGGVAARLGLAGKPAPDTFLEAARELGAEPARAVVVEDAIAGVQAGRAGKFGLVVGIDRKGNPAALEQNGADVVVTDLRDLLPSSSS